MNSSKPYISIIIPVKNGASTLARCLDAIYNQTVINQSEIIIIDSGSTDGSLDIIKEYDVNIYQIESEIFNHGLTRNYGVSLAKGDLVYFTVQDACLADSYALERMVSHFSDSTVMAVIGRQIVPHDKNTNPHQWFRPVNQPKVERFSFVNSEEFDNLPDYEKRWACGLDDVNAMYRYNAFLNLHFRDLQFAEDMVWAADAYRLGYAIVLDPMIRVYHYHHQDYNFAYKVSLLCTFVEWKYLGIIPDSRLKISDYLLIIYRNAKYKAHPKWIFIQMQFLLGQHRAKTDFKKKVLSGRISPENFIKNKIRTIPQGKIKYKS